MHVKVKYPSFLSHINALRSRPIRISSNVLTRSFEGSSPWPLPWESPPRSVGYTKDFTRRENDFNFRRGTNTSTKTGFLSTKSCRRMSIERQPIEAAFVQVKLPCVFNKIRRAGSIHR